MVREQDRLHVVNASDKGQTSGLTSIPPLRQAAVGMGGRGRLKTKDLVGLLLAHGARSWRASSSRAHLRLHVEAPNGGLAIRIRL